MSVFMGLCRYDINDVYTPIASAGVSGFWRYGEERDTILYPWDTNNRMFSSEFCTASRTQPFSSETVSALIYGEHMSMSTEPAAIFPCLDLSN